MIKIRNPKELKSFFGEPLIEIERNEEEGTTERRTLGLARLLRNFISNLRVEDMTGSERLYDCAQAIREAEKNGNDTIEFNNRDYKWLVNMVAKQAPKLMGGNAVVLRDALEDVVTEGENAEDVGAETEETKIDGE